MLTGDHEASARRVAKAVGIKEVNYSLKPEDKLFHVTSISRDTGESQKLAMRGFLSCFQAHFRFPNSKQKNYLWFCTFALT